MGKIPISYKAYDNIYRIPMGISITVGGSTLVSGLFSNEKGLFAVGVIGIGLFFFFKYLNYREAKKEIEANFMERMKFFEQDVLDVLNNNEVTDETKIRQIIQLSEDGNEYATIFLQQLYENINGEK